MKSSASEPGLKQSAGNLTDSICIIKEIVIHLKYFPDSDWLKAHA